MPRGERQHRFKRPYRTKGRATGGVGRNVYRRALARYLARATDEFFFRMIWAVDAIHTGRAEAARKCGFEFDTAYDTKSMTANRVFHWELDTLINELLIIPKAPRGRARELHLDCTKYTTALVCAQALRKLENAEDGPALDRVGVISEIHRLTQRQFEWQRGFEDLPSLYRSVRIFGQGPSAGYFETTHGLTVANFVLFGFVLAMAFSRRPVWKSTSSMKKFDVPDEVRDKGLARIATSISGARSLATNLRPPHLHTAYRPSVLRQYPVILFGEHRDEMAAPIVGLIVQRITSGLYHDVVGGGSPVWNAIGKEFESYAIDLLRPLLPSLSITPERKYRFKKNDVYGPDIEIAQAGKVTVAIECKAKRLTFAARFSEDPMTEAGQAYGEIVKGVFQIWRYFSRVRRGILPDVTLGKYPVGMVLTLDPWLAMANKQGAQVMDAARHMAKEKEFEILKEDECPILFTSIQELELCLLTGTEETFLKSIAIAADGSHEAWLLSAIHNQLVPDDAAVRDYPFSDDIARLLPWWAAIT